MAERNLASATSSSSAAATTGLSPLSIWPRRVSNRWSSNAASKSAAPPSPTNFIPASAVLRWPIRPVRFVPTSCATCNSKSTGCKLITPGLASPRFRPTGAPFRSIKMRANRRGNRGVLAERRSEVSRVRRQSLGKMGKVIARGSGHNPARHRPSQRRRSVEHAEDRPRHSQPGQERYVSPAALGPDGGRRFGRGILRNGTAARRDRCARNLRNISRTLVGGKQPGSADSRRRRSSSRRLGVILPRAEWAL